MKLSHQTITALQKIITGDCISKDVSIAPYRSGPQLVEFFNQFLEKEEFYGSGFPSRWVYCESKLGQLNGNPVMKKLIEDAIDPRNFIGTNFNLNDAVNYLNTFLEYDGYKLFKTKNRYLVRSITEPIVPVDVKIIKNGVADLEFIEDQLKKCEDKIKSEDYDGSITNARSLIESVLVAVDYSITGEKIKYDGDLMKLYKTVQKHLNLSPARDDISNSLKSVLSGLISIISGIGFIRNKMSDSHVRTYKPAKHHAVLIVNASRTLVRFLLDSYEYQKNKWNIQISTENPINS